MVENHTLHVPVTERVLQGTTFHRPAWLYALWAHAALSRSPAVWLILEVVLFGGWTALVLWRLGKILGYTPFETGLVLIFAGWFVMPEQWLRPQVALVPAVASLWLWILRDFQGENPSPGRVLLLSAFAANMHGGILLLGVFLGLWALLRRDPGRILKTLAAWGLGSSLHPYFPEPWRTNLEFGLHPPHVTEWEALIFRVLQEPPGVAVLWLFPAVLLILLLPALRKRDLRYRYLVLVTGITFALAWFRASRFITWGMLSLGLLLPGGWPPRLTPSRPVSMGMLASLAVLGLLRFPWVEDRVNFRALLAMRPPRELTWGVGRTAHVLCRAWPDTPLLSTGLDAIHPTLNDAIQADVRYAVTHDRENAAFLPLLREAGARPVARQGPYTLWHFELDRSSSNVHP